MINPAPRCRFDLVKSVSVVEVFFLGSVRTTIRVTFTLAESGGVRPVKVPLRFSRSGF